MSDPLSSAFMGQLSSLTEHQPMTDGALPVLGELSDSVEFKDIISQQGVSPEMLEQLKQVLPDGKFRQLEELLTNGNLLPQTAEIADGLPASGMGSLFQMMALLEEQDIASNVETEPNLAAVTAISAPVVTESVRSILIKEHIGGSEKHQSLSIISGELLEKGSSINPDAKLPLPGNNIHSMIAAGKVESGLEQAAMAIAKTPVVPMMLDLSTGTVSTTPVGLSGIQNAIESSNLQRVDTPPAINVPPGGKGWNNAVSERVLWMVGQQMQSASIRITPPHLGPIDIHVSFRNDEASVTFLAQHGVVKEAIEAAIPRLREMFNDNNLQLANVDVGQRESADQRPLQHFHRNSADGAKFANSDGGDLDEAGEETDLIGNVNYQTGQGLVDYYA